MTPYPPLNLMDELHKALGLPSKRRDRPNLKRKALERMTRETVAFKGYDPYNTSDMYPRALYRCKKPVIPFGTLFANDAFEDNHNA
jgi:hypothetical protein